MPKLEIFSNYTNIGYHEIIIERKIAEKKREKIVKNKWVRGMGGG